MALVLSSSEEEEPFTSSIDDEEETSYPFGFLLFSFFLSLAIFCSSLKTFNSEVSWSAFDQVGVEGFVPFPLPLDVGTCSDPPSLDSFDSRHLLSKQLSSLMKSLALIPIKSCLEGVNRQ
jgi:hypothetical protein